MNKSLTLVAEITFCYIIFIFLVHKKMPAYNQSIRWKKIIKRRIEGERYAMSTVTMMLSFADITIVGLFMFSYRVMMTCCKRDA